MLIPSERHTPDDLELWRELERADLITPTPRIETANDGMRSFLAGCPCYISVSWGKDSVVAAWLALQIAPLPLVHFRSPENKYPGVPDVRDEFLRRFPADYHEFVVTWPQRGAADWRKRNELAADRLGTPRRIVGVRSAESSARWISMCCDGVVAGDSCRPLIDWTTAEVFAVAAQHWLPLHSSYAMLGGGRWDRSRLRVSGLAGSPGDGHGRALWEAEYYGDVLRRLQMKQ